MKKTRLALWSLICVALLLAPLTSFLPGFDRSKIYRAMDGRRSIEQSHYQMLFQEEGDVTVAFIGPSSMWVGINSKRVEQHLVDAGVDAPAVITLGANHPSEDLTYVMAKDLLAKRKVEWLVLPTPNRQQDHAHPVLHRLASLKDQGAVWSKLPLVEQLRSYALATLGAPLQIYQQFVPRDVPPNMRNLVRFNGSWIRNAGWARSKFEPFAVDATPIARAPISQHRLFNANSEKVAFSNVFSDYQKTYFAETVALARSHGTKVAVLSTPIWKDRASDKPVVRIEQELIKELQLPILGIAPANLFSGLSEDDIKKLYYDVNHFNTNGANYFTDVMSPAILELVKDD